MVTVVRLGEADKTILAGAVKIMTDSKFIDSDSSATLIKKVEENKLSAEDIGVLLAKLELFAKAKYEEIANMYSKEATAGQNQRALLTAKKLEIKIINKAINVVKSASEQAGNEKGTGTFCILPLLPMSLPLLQADVISILLGIVGLASAVYALMIVKKCKASGGAGVMSENMFEEKKKKKEEEEEPF